MPTIVLLGSEALSQFNILSKELRQCIISIDFHRQSFNICKNYEDGLSVKNLSSQLLTSFKKLYIHSQLVSYNINSNEMFDSQRRMKEMLYKGQYFLTETIDLDFFNIMFTLIQNSVKSSYSDQQLLLIYNPFSAIAALVPFIANYFATISLSHLHLFQGYRFVTQQMHENYLNFRRQTCLIQNMYQLNNFAENSEKIASVCRFLTSKYSSFAYFNCLQQLSLSEQSVLIVDLIVNKDKSIQNNIRQLLQQHKVSTYSFEMGFCNVYFRTIQNDELKQSVLMNEIQKIAKAYAQNVFVDQLNYKTAEECAIIVYCGSFQTEMLDFVKDFAKKRLVQQK